MKAILSSQKFLDCGPLHPLRSARAYHPDDLRKNDKLQVDVDYYLKNQVHPVVSRLLEPIEGTNNAQIAECLGLDPSAFRREYTMQVWKRSFQDCKNDDYDRFLKNWRKSCSVWPGELITNLSSVICA